MSKIINCVVDTYSKKERKELIDYISGKDKFISILSDQDGFQLFAISNNSCGQVGVLTASKMVREDYYKHFFSIEEFIEYQENNDDGK